MAHFAKLDENNNVIAVHVVNNDVITIDGIESEQAGIDFLTSLHGHSLWKQTSYNENFRKNYAGVGMYFDPAKDAFITPKPFVSWVLNETTCRWEPPISYPSDGKLYEWDETQTSWIELTRNISEVTDTQPNIETKAV
jgi:hypothetical protein